MKRVLRAVWLWAPPIILMITIFILSSRQNIGVSDSEAVNFSLFKSLHVIEYCILYLLFFRAYLGSGISYARSILYGAISALGYGILDEVHQTFVPTRTGTLRDVFIDMIGISIGVLYTKYNTQFIKKILRA